MVNVRIIDVMNHDDESKLCYTLNTSCISDGFLLNPDKLSYAGLKELIIIQCSLFEFPSAITKLISLTYLDISFNNIRNLSLEIGHLVKLKYLKCNFNQITAVPMSLGRLTELKVFEIARNNLSKLPNNIEFLQKLEVFDISYNMFSDLSGCLPISKSLKVLKSRSNLLKEIPAVLSNCSNLTECDFSKNVLIKIPTWLVCLPNLRHLNMSENMIYDFNLNDPYLISQLEVLKLNKNAIIIDNFDFEMFPDLRALHSGNNGRLNQTRNSMANFNKTLLTLNYIERLDFCGLGLNELPENFGCLTHLVWLDLSFNDLYGLSSSISNLKNLQYLNISRNNIDHLPEHFGFLPLLEHLHLDHNLLTELPDSFASLENMIYCDMSFNHFEDFPDVIHGLKSIQYLDIYMNKFKVDIKSQPVHITLALKRSSGWKFLSVENRSREAKDRSGDKMEAECRVEARFEERFVDRVYGYNDYLEKDVQGVDEDDVNDGHDDDHNYLRDRIIMQDSNFEWDSEDCFSTFHESFNDQKKPERNDDDDIFEDAEEN